MSGLVSIYRGEDMNTKALELLSNHFELTRFVYCLCFQANSSENITIFITYNKCCKLYSFLHLVAR